MKRRHFVLGAAVAAVAGGWWLRPSDRGGPYSEYFRSLNDELKAHGVDAVVGDNGVVEHYVANNGAEQLKIVEDSSFAPEQFGIVVKKGNTELLEKINQGLAAIKADGTYDKIYAKYFKPAAKQ